MQTIYLYHPLSFSWKGCVQPVPNSLKKTCPNNNHNLLYRLTAGKSFIVFSVKKTKPGLVQGMHESQGKNDHQHHHDQGIDLPRWWGRLSLVGVYRAQGNPMRQTHSIAAKNPGNVSYVSCKLYVLVSLEGANFKESIIIYYPYLAIPKP